MARQAKKGGLSQTNLETEEIKSKLSGGLATLLTIMVLIPSVILLFYVSGVWGVIIDNGKVIRDTTDDIVIAGSFFNALFAVIIIHLHT